MSIFIDGRSWLWMKIMVPVVFCFIDSGNVLFCVASRWRSPYSHWNRIQRI
jgi:hypothetical protein